MNRPPEQPPPYGALIEAAREDAGLSRREAARRAGISDSWWRYVAAGWQNGPITGTARVVAAMARVVGVTPDQLENEGERPDAARILRKEGGGPGAPPATGQSPLRAVPAPSAGGAVALEVLFAMLDRRPDDEALAAEVLAALMSLFPDDKIITDVLGSQAEEGKPARVIVKEMREWLEFLASRDGLPQNGTSAG